MSEAWRSGSVCLWWALSSLPGINEEVHKCIFKPICDKIKQETEPVCCPLVNVLMKAIDLKTGFTPEALPIAMEGDVCKIGLGKMGNDDVVEAKGVF